ncbi:MAG: LysR substrate-binding domain-containing protein, partial [Betaproteobacteria bacterium]
VLFEPPARRLVNDPEAVAMAARLGWGIGLAGLPHVHRALADGTLRRVLPGYWADAGAIRVYHAHGRLVPAKVRGFVDVLVAASRAGRWQEVLSGGRRVRSARTPAPQRPAGPEGSRRLRERP